jgi:GNAT superfamily N-acetyltransferase
MVSTYTIRPASLEDAPMLAALGAQTFRETFESICTSQDLSEFLAAAYSDAIQRTELSDPSRPAIVLETDGRPVGFAQLRLGHREPCVTGSRPVELQRIYVLREAHGSGFGAALMEASVAQARAWGADVLWLGVWEHNDRALAFYARHGFREAGDHVFQIGQQVDRDLILVKDLA